ncbi:hypothetical protein ColKHC_03881 [Colletotrichum higginsianum]|nr:hypothetical protein ColKHC_03881 [Colletotrichum higginsianum]
MDFKNKALLIYILVVRRANTCPIRTRKSWWRCCQEASMTPYDPAMPAGDASRLFWSLKDVGYPHTTSFVKELGHLYPDDSYNYAGDREYRLSRLPRDPNTCDAHVVLKNERLVNERLKGAIIQAECNAQPDWKCRVTEFQYASALKLVELKLEAEEYEKMKREESSHEANATLGSDAAVVLSSEPGTHDAE